ncbi:MAG: Mth938-like domain-containing protein [Candidatus Methylarchaceae archaeon HK01B]|nr:Mth938-like domain-containing protein [Candidatus Methylarchaceae archaeon HK01M]MCP8312377.1 Mth938-like domain-containing protein [Candidatus Methylarchaceae archaeon HK02M1]MCP8318567.1 Mth938-like domain-containing protein [Candidatus Methylarchaceae archaeon HK01B]
MIDSYKFGVIVINGRAYTSDVIIFPEKVLDSWWRKEGHRLYVEDLKEVFKAESKPEVLVVGTGYSGFMKISEKVLDELRSRRIKMIAQPTKQACQTFNELFKSGRKVIAAFHLTC